MFIDTHSHLYDEAFSAEEDAAVERALKEGVGKLVFPDIDSRSRHAMLSLAGRYPGIIFPGMGLHPTEVGPGWEDELAMVLDAGKDGIYAIGEIGLDFYWSREFEKEQEEVFDRQLSLARQLDLPVIIHNREATDATLRAVRRHPGLRGVFHAFTGSIETFREIQRLDGDWYVGIGGVVTFKKASIGETVREIPLERILLETDCPYLTPVPHRGERNESSYIPLIAATLADKKGIGIDEVAEVTTGNAEKLFAI